MSDPEVWRLTSADVDIARGALIGVVNVTPDSFSGGGRFVDSDQAVGHGLALAEAGASVVDVGGESTRPGAKSVPAGVELGRVVPVVKRLAEEGVVVSVDTYKPEVAQACLDVGAQAVNDITGFTDPSMVELAAASGCGVIVMHMQGAPETMSIDPRYIDVAAEVEQFLLTSTSRLQDAGVDRSRIAIDPGFGFGKRAHHSIALLAAVRDLATIGFPVVVGTSRKGFLAALASATETDLDSLTAITTALTFGWGARLFRVHDVSKSRDALEYAAESLALDN